MQPLYYNIGMTLPSGQFTRETTEKGVNRLRPADEAMQAILTSPEAQDRYITVYGYTSQVQDDADLWGPFYLDFDSPADIALALADTRKALDVIATVYPVQAVEIYYSGGKGFHVLVNAEAMGITPLPDLNFFYKWLARSIADDLKLSTCDRKVYDRSRLWRVPNTLNVKGHAYKVPLTLDEIRFFDVAQIRQLAQAPRTLPTLDEEPITDADVAKAQAFTQKALTQWRATEGTRSTHYDDAKISAIPEGVQIPCVQNLLSEVFAAGQGRNSVLYTLACYAEGQKWDAERIMAWLLSINRNYEPPLETREVQHLAKSAHENRKSVGCTTDLLAERCPGRPHCWYFQHARPPEEVQGDSRYTFTDTDTGFTMTTTDGWTFTVVDMIATSKRSSARLKAVSPSKKSALATVNLLASSSLQSFTKQIGVQGEERTALREHWNVLSSTVADYHERGIEKRGAVATESRDDGPRKVRLYNGHYEAWHNDGWQIISNFTLEVMRLYHVLEADGETSCVREVVFHGQAGGTSRPKRADKRVLADKSGFTKFCTGAGDYSWTGSEADLQHIKETFLFCATVADEAFVIDHIGHVQMRDMKYSAFCWGNAAVVDGHLVTPDDNGTFAFPDRNIILRGINLSDQWERSPWEPRVCLDYLNNPNGLLDLRRKILDITKASLLDYRAWLALGVAYAGMYLPEIVAKYHGFPGIFAAGPMGSGKNTVLRWIQGAVGLPVNNTFCLPATTEASLQRHMAYYSGYPMVMDEFRNTRNMEEKVHMIRNWYDRINKSVASRVVSGATITLPVRGWSIIAGQDVCQDTAFMSRYITMVMQGRFRSTNQALKQDIDTTMREQASAIALDMMLRKDDATVARVLDTIGKGHAYYMDKLTGAGSERMAFNYAVAIAGFAEAFGPVLFQQELDDMQQWVVSQGDTRQRELDRNSEAVSFLEDLLVMAQSRTIEAGVHYLYPQEYYVETKDRGAREVRNAWCVWIRGAHTAWRKWQGNPKESFAMNAILYALQNEAFYVGIADVIFNQSVTRECVVLDLDAMPQLDAAHWRT